MKRLALVTGILCLQAGLARATPARAQVISVEVRTTSSGTAYSLVRGSLSGTVDAAGGSQTRYKVPFWLGYARDCGGGVVEPLHFSSSFSFLGLLSTGALGEQVVAPFEDVLDGTTNLFRAGRGTWMGILNLADQLEALKGTTFNGIALDASYTIEDPVLAQYHIIRDASLVERRAGTFLRRELSRLHATPPCDAPNVIAVGFSQTGGVVKSFYHNGFNTTLAGDRAFTRGQVFDGALPSGVDEWCHSAALDDYVQCPGAAPFMGQGKVMTLNPEADVLGGAAFARDTDGLDPDYRVYEVAGVTHISTSAWDLAAFGLRPEKPEQASARVQPVARAALENMRRWLEGVSPPPSVFIDLGGAEPDWDRWPIALRPPAISPPLFDTERADFDYNVDGGVRLPHVRTEIAPGVIVGAPLGAERGGGCLNLQPVADPFFCDGDFLVALTGDFVPYTELDVGDLPDPCAAYGSRAQYLTQATLAAAYAAARRWVLVEDLAGMVADAEARLASHPGCVPE